MDFEIVWVMAKVNLVLNAEFIEFLFWKFRKSKIEAYIISILSLFISIIWECTCHPFITCFAGIQGECVLFMYNEFTCWKIIINPTLCINDIENGNYLYLMWPKKKKMYLGKWSLLTSYEALDRYFFPQFVREIINFCKFQSVIRTLNMNI